MRLKDIHNDIERYLNEDCYCPGEIYDVTGFFFRVYKPDEECEEISRMPDHRNQKETVVTVICGDQIINFWINDEKVVSAERYDATENNIRIIPLVVAGTNSSEDRLDEFKPMETAKGIAEIFNVADAIMID